jgi:hypothetical protein
MPGQAKKVAMRCTSPRRVPGEPFVELAIDALEMPLVVEVLKPDRVCRARGWLGERTIIIRSRNK